MTGETLYDALTNVDEGLIDEAAEPLARAFSWKRAGAWAAAVAVIVGAGAWIVPQLGGRAAPGSGSAGHGEGSAFMSYAGPILPVTLKAPDADITAERALTLDYAPLLERKTKAEIGDRYVLTNAGGDKELSVLVPFVSCFRDLSADLPTVRMDGAEIDGTALFTGSSAGGFQPVAGSQDPGLWNLYFPEKWDDYKALLESGSYLAAALGDAPGLDVPVVVYRFTDPVFPADVEAENPTIRATFTMDETKTRVLTYGFNGGYYHSEDGRNGRIYSIPEEGMPGWGEAVYLIAVGEDIRDLTVTGQPIGDPDRDAPQTEGAAATVERQETTLAAVLPEILASAWGDLRIQVGDVTEWLSVRDYDALYARCVADLIVSSGLLSPEKAIARYDDGRLDDLLGDALAMDRVFYLEVPLSLPAGGSAELEVHSVKALSFDFDCAGTENAGVYGLDAATRLGSNLVCARQQATLEDRGCLEIVRQNFGFDLDQGVKTVPLTQEHYYLEVRRIETEQ